MKKLIRNIDDSGRVVIPADFRELFGMYDKVEIVLKEDGVLIRPYNKNAQCAVTGNTSNLNLYAGIVLSDEGLERLLKEINNKNKHDEVFTDIKGKELLQKKGD